MHSNGYINVVGTGDAESQFVSIGFHHLYAAAILEENVVYLVCLLSVRALTLDFPELYYSRVLRRLAEISKLTN